MTIIVDYGIGNVFSVQRSFEHCGDKNIKLSNDPHEIKDADRVILPGVGAFKDGMKGLEERELIEPLQECIKRGTPFLGICLGMQMLVSSSKEFGNHAGLDFIEGQVIPIIEQKYNNTKELKIPHIGWAKLNKNKDNQNQNQNQNLILNDFSFDSYVYLVHSYHVKTKNPLETIATYNYDEIEITAAIQKENIIGFQFHPEKSGQAGLDIIKKFLSL